MGQEKAGYLFGFLGVVIFSATLPATRIAVAELDPIVAGLGRALIAAVLAAIALLATKAKRPEGREWGRLLAVALGVVVGFPALSAWAMTRVPAAHGGVVLGILPLATAAFGALLAKERPPLLFWIFSLVGSALVIAFSLRQGGGGLDWADLALVGAVVAASYGYAEGAKLSRSLGSWQVISWTLVVSAPFLALPVGFVAAEQSWDLSWQTWAAFAYVAFFSQYLGFFAWYRGLALAGIGKVGQVQLLQTFLTLGLAALLLGETVGLETLIFALAVVGSVALGRHFSRKDKGPK